MTLFRPADPRPVHFMGIGGAGMSALATVARQRGVRVTGCDTDPSGAADLAASGVQVWQGHDPQHLEGVQAVVVTAAVPPDHPELVQAREAGIPVIRRADALGQAVAGGMLVAVAGTHGKTTTTVMVTEALTAAGRNPTGLVGGRVAGWGGNARVGGTDLYVVEADEFDRAFLSLVPTVAVVANVEADHLECYGTIAALEDAFAQFAGGARRVIAGGDDAGAQRVAARLGGKVWRGGVGADEDAALRALAEFTGVARRFERVGEAAGVTVMDDYAHHPTEVGATLAAARQAFPGRRLVAVFQPHLYSRTAMHGDALGKALAAADLVVVAPIYGARERPLPGVTSDLVARGAIGAGAATVAVRERTALAAAVAERLRAGDVVFTLGAGDVTRIGPELMTRLARPRSGTS